MAGSNFVSASPLTTVRERSLGALQHRSSRTGQGSTPVNAEFFCPDREACVQTDWKHSPDIPICNDVDWWPGSEAEREAAPPGYSLADHGAPLTRPLTARGAHAKYLSMATLFMCVGEVQSANIVTEIAQEQTPFVRSMVVGLCVLAIVKLLLHLYRKHSMQRTASHVVTNDSSARGARYSLDPLSATVGVVVRVMYMSLKGLIHGMIGRVQLAAVTTDNFMKHVRERKKPVYLRAYYASTAVVLW